MAVARVDADAVFSLLTGAETERAFDRVGRRLTRRLTNGRFDTLYPAQREAAWQLTFGQNPVVAQLPTGKGKGAISLLWMCATGGVVLECVIFYIIYMRGGKVIRRAELSISDSDT